MKVKVKELNGAEFKVSFRRVAVILDKTQKHGYQFRNQNGTDKVVQASIATECRIIALPGREVCAFGVSVCDTRDNFCKSDGRRRALTKALYEMRTSTVMTQVVHKMMPLEDVEEKSKPCLKKVRTEFWHAYFSEMDKGRAKVYAG